MVEPEQVPGLRAQVSLQEGVQVLPGAGRGSQQLGGPVHSEQPPQTRAGTLVFGGP